MNQTNVLQICDLKELEKYGKFISDAVIEIATNTVKGFTFYNCSVKKINSFSTLVFEDCVFEGCDKVDFSAAKNCSFINCNNVDFRDEEKIESCVFDNIGFLFTSFCSIENCEFKNLKNLDGEDCVISLDQVKMRNCTFDGVTLTEDAFLIDADSDSEIENCTFKNCATSRFDKEIIKCEEQRGTLFKKTVKFDITFNCKGLRSVTSLDENII